MQKERSGRYDLGREAAELGVAAISRNNFVVRASEELEELATMTGQAALLAVWSHNGPTVIRLERGPHLTTTSIACTPSSQIAGVYLFPRPVHTSRELTGFAKLQSRNWRDYVHRKTCKVAETFRYRQ